MFRDGVGIYCHLSPRFSSCYINDMLILACVPVVYKNITSYFINIQYNLKLEFSYIMKRILWFLFFISVLSSLLFQSTFSWTLPNIWISLLLAPEKKAGWRSFITNLEILGFCNNNFTIIRITCNIINLVGKGIILSSMINSTRINRITN